MSTMTITLQRALGSNMRSVADAAESDRLGKGQRLNRENGARSINAASQELHNKLPLQKMRVLATIALWTATALVLGLLVGAHATQVMHKFEYREPDGQQRLDVPGYTNRVLFSFQLEDPTTSVAGTTHAVDKLTLLAPPGFIFNKTCTRDFTFQHHLIFDTGMAPAPVTNFAELIPSTTGNTSCVGSVDPDTGRGRLELELVTTSLVAENIYPFAIRMTNPLEDPLVNASAVGQSPEEINAFTLLLNGWNATLPAFPLSRFKDVKVRLSQRNRSPTCLNPTVACPVHNINSYRIAIDCLYSGCVEESQVALQFKAFKAVGVGGRLEVHLPLYYAMSPHTSCEAWRRPLASVVWTPWLPRDMRCRVAADLQSITMDFVDKTQLYLQPDFYEYRVEFTVLLPNGLAHLEQDVSKYFFWIFGYDPGEAFELNKVDPATFGVVEVERSALGMALQGSSAEEVLAQSLGSVTTTTTLAVQSQAFLYSGGSAFKTLSNSLYSRRPLPADPYPSQAVRIQSLTLHSSSDLFEVAARSPFERQSRAILGGEIIELYFYIRFRFQVYPGTRVHLTGPLGYDFSTFCTTVVEMELILNLLQVKTVTPGQLDGWECASSATEMVLTRIGYVEYMGQTPLSLRVMARNPMTVEAWNKLDNFWEIMVLGTSTTTTTTAAPRDCRGVWSAYDACNPLTGYQQRNYTIVEPAEDGGLDCPRAHGEIDTLPCASRSDANCTAAFGPFDTCQNGRKTSRYGVVYDAGLNNSNVVNGCPHPDDTPVTHSCGQNCVAGWTAFGSCTQNQNALCFFGYLLDLATATVPQDYAVIDAGYYHDLLYGERNYPETFFRRTDLTSDEGNMTGQVGYSLNSCPATSTAAKSLVNAGQTGAIGNITLAAEEYRYFRVKTLPGIGGKACPFATDQIQTRPCAVYYSSPSSTTTSTTTTMCPCSDWVCGNATALVCTEQFETYTNHCVALRAGKSLIYPGACGLRGNEILEAKSYLSYKIVPQFQNPVVRLTGLKRGAGVKTKLEFEFYALSSANTLYLFSEPRLDLDQISFAEVETVDPKTGQRRLEVRQPFGYDPELTHPLNPLVVGIMSVNAITIPGNYSQTFFRLVDLIFPVGTQQVRYTIRSFTDKTLRDEMFFEGFELPGGITLHDINVRGSWFQKAPAAQKSQYMLPRANVHPGRIKVTFSVANGLTRFLEIRSGTSLQFSPVDVCLYEQATGVLLPLRAVKVYQSPKIDGTPGMDDILHLELGTRGDESEHENAVFGTTGSLIFDSSLEGDVALAMKQATGTNANGALVLSAGGVASASSTDSSSDTNTLSGSETAESSADAALSSLTSSTSTSTIFPPVTPVLSLNQSLELSRNRMAFPILRGDPSQAFTEIRIPISEALPDAIPLPETVKPVIVDRRELDEAGTNAASSSSKKNVVEEDTLSLAAITEGGRRLHSHTPAGLRRIVMKMEFDMIFQEYTEVYTNWLRPSTLVMDTTAPPTDAGSSGGAAVATSTTTTTTTTTTFVAGTISRVAYGYDAFNTVVQDAIARTLFCDNGDYHLFGSYTKYWDTADLAPQCANKPQFVWQQPRIQVLDMRPGFYDDFGHPLAVTYDFLENVRAGGQWEPDLLGGDTGNPWKPGLQGPEECKGKCSEFRNCTLFQYSKVDKTCHWRFTDSPWEPTPRFSNDINSFAQRGITVFLEIKKNVSSQEQSAPALFAALRERLINPRSNFLHDPDFYPFTQRVTGLHSVADDGTIVTPEVDTTTTTTTTPVIISTTTTTTTCPFADPNDTNSSRICPMDEMGMLNSTVDDGTSFQELANFTMPWWVNKTAHYLVYRQDRVCPSRVERWGGGNYSFYSDLSSYGNSLHIRTPQGILDHKWVNMTYKEAGPFTLEPRTQYVADFFVRTPSTTEPTEPQAQSTWALDTWIDPSFSPTDPQNTATGALPINTNDFLDVGPGALGDLDGPGELSKAVTSHNPASALLTIDLTLRTSKGGKKFILYAAENFTFSQVQPALWTIPQFDEETGEELPRQSLLTKYLGFARMSWVYVRQNAAIRATDEVTYYNNFEVDTRLQQRDMRFRERDTIEIKCPPITLQPEPGIFTTTDDCKESDPMPIRVNITSPRTLTAVSTFFFESYDENDVLLGYGEVEGFRLSSLQAQVTWSKMAQVYQTVVGLTVTTRVVVPMLTKLRLKAPHGIYLSCYNLDTFWRPIRKCQSADAWRHFYVILNQTIPAGEKIQLASAIMGLSPIHFDMTDRTFDLYLEEQLLGANIDVKHDFYETDGFQVVESLYVERPFPPGLHAHGNEMTLYLNFARQLGPSLVNITMTFPPFMFPPPLGAAEEAEYLLLNGDQAEGASTTTTTTTKQATSGEGTSSTNATASGLNNGTGTSSLTTEAPGTTAEPASGAALTGEGSSGAAAAGETESSGSEANTGEGTGEVGGNGVTSAESTTATSTTTFNVYNYDAANPIVFYENEPLPVKSVHTMNTATEKTVTLIVNDIVPQGRYGIRVTLRGNYFERAKNPGFNRLDKAIYLRMHFNNSEFTTFFYGGAEKLEDFELDPQYYTLKDPRPSFSSGWRRRHCSFLGLLLIVGAYAIMSGFAEHFISASRRGSYSQPLRRGTAINAITKTTSSSIARSFSELFFAGLKLGSRAPLLASRTGVETSTTDHSSSSKNVGMEQTPATSTNGCKSEDQDQHQHTDHDTKENQQVVEEQDGAVKEPLQTAFSGENMDPLVARSSSSSTSSSTSSAPLQTYSQISALPDLAHALFTRWRQEDRQSAATKIKKLATLLELLATSALLERRAIKRRGLSCRYSIAETSRSRGRIRSLVTNLPLPVPALASSERGIGLLDGLFFIFGIGFSRENDHDHHHVEQNYINLRSCCPCPILQEMAGSLPGLHLCRLWMDKG
ncbi:unnamed protein product [Amoebophrya sp. A25]|nr:unnamed protein product [Amoebophrya sp. A25]|eukprot:GSA25T00015678001.1